MRKDLEILQQGMLNEVEGATFYRMAAEQAEDEEIKENFLELAEEEDSHYSYLKSMFKVITDDKKIDFDSLVNQADSPNIFVWEKREVDKPEILVTVYGMAIQNEKKSIDFYRDKQKEVESEDVLKLLKLLEKWEYEHLKQFLPLYEYYKEQWWFDQSFAPF
ncbi:MAG: ferritin family protein [Eubacteriales bacterium]|nr:ferritin family protein [Eubacteriales bacterium]MDD4324300.1 ferritin family protein [Eubacteriales bacterium]MDD4541037.1 ferritin family protein [Eubacteriales bacterium]